MTGGGGGGIRSDDYGPVALNSVLGLGAKWAYQCWCYTEFEQFDV